MSFKYWYPCFADTESTTSAFLIVTLMSMCGLAPQLQRTDPHSLHKIRKTHGSDNKIGSHTQPCALKIHVCSNTRELLEFI